LEFRVYFIKHSNYQSELDYCLQANLSFNSDPKFQHVGTFCTDNSNIILIGIFLFVEMPS